MNLIEKLELEAHSYMMKVLSKEKRMADEFKEIIEDLEEEIYTAFKKSGDISLSFIESFILNEIVPIVNDYKAIQLDFLENSINSQFENGIKHAQSLMSLTPMELQSLTDERQNTYYEEVLLALLLFGRKLIDSLNEDIIKKVHNDTISIYISSKNINGSSVNNTTRDTEKDSTVNTVVSGIVISKYINSTFKNIRNRADAIARTETNRALNHGHLLRYMGANVKYVKWIEVRDERVCKHCRAAALENDGIYLVDEIAPPPLHGRCRCILVPYYPEWLEIEY